MTPPLVMLVAVSVYGANMLLEPGCVAAKLSLNDLLHSHEILIDAAI